MCDCVCDVLAGNKRSQSDEGTKLREAVLKARDMPQPQKWVELLEDTPSLLYPGLVRHWLLPQPLH